MALWLPYDLLSHSAVILVPLRLAFTGRTSLDSGVPCPPPEAALPALPHTLTWVPPSLFQSLLKCYLFKLNFPKCYLS